MQLPPGVGLFKPECATAEKVEPGAEAGFSDDKRQGVVGSKAFCQPIGIKKDVLCLGYAALTVEVDIVKQGRTGYTLLPFKLCLLQRLG